MAGDSPVSSFLSEQVGQHRKISAMVRPIKLRRKGNSRPTQFVKRIGHFVHGRFYGWHARRLARSISRQLFDRPTWPEVPVEEIADHQLNGPEGIRLLTALRPDLLIVCGAPILKPQIFSIPTIGAINLHFGVVPKYRGQNTLFWALYHRDYEHVGFTLHRIDSGVDAGAVIARGYPALDRHDTEATLWTKSVRMASAVLIEFLEETLTRGEFASRSQTDVLRAYREQDRTMWRDLHFAWKRRVLNQRPRTQAAKIERFYRETS